MRDMKPFELQKNAKTAQFQARRKYEESTIKTDTEDIDHPPSGLLINATAKKEYFRALKNLRLTVGLVGNLNMADLAMYANCYARYTDCVKQMRRKGFSPVIETENGAKENPVIGMMDKAQRGMMDAEKRLGMTFDGILKAASARVEKEEKQMESRFGAI